MVMNLSEAFEDDCPSRGYSDKTNKLYFVKDNLEVSRLIFWYFLESNSEWCWISCSSNVIDHIEPLFNEYKIQSDSIRMINPMQQSLQHKIKVVFVGDLGVGKSSIISRFSRQQYSLLTKATIGVQFSIRQAEAYVKGQLCKITLQLWDTAGQERFRSVSSSFFKNALAVVIVYDITKRETFENLQKWYELSNNTCNQFATYIVLGNKTDLTNLRTVDYRQGEKWASDHNSLFCQTSGLADYNITRAMEMLLMEIVQKLNRQGPGTGQISRYSQASRYSIDVSAAANNTNYTSCC